MSLDYYNLAVKRKSVREFRKKEVDEGTLSKIQEYFSSVGSLVEGLEVEMKLLKGSDSVPLLTSCAGYNKFLVEAPHYLLLLSSKGEHYLENAGYMGEEMVLKMTDLGLSCCWVTITDEPLLCQRLRLDSDKAAAALIAFGYEPGGIFKRLDIKSPSNVSVKKRKGFAAPKISIDHAVYDRVWGMEEQISNLDTESTLSQACIAACCAPSFFNIQPYRFIHDIDKMVLVALDNDTTGPEDTCLNLGIVMRHFAAVMERQNSLFEGWKMEVPEGNFELPENAKAVSYCML